MARMDHVGDQPTGRGDAFTDDNLQPVFRSGAQDGAETRRATEASTAEEDKDACVPADMHVYDSDGYYSDA